MDSVLTIGLSPTFQKIIVFSSFRENEVNRSSEVRQVCSGKAINVSKILKKLGRESLNLLPLGGIRKDEFISLCKKEGVNILPLEVKAEIRTCTTIINKEKKTSTELVEESNRVEEIDSTNFFNLFLKEVDNHRAVVISGTKAPGFSSSLIPEIVRESKKRSKLVILDVKGDDLKESLKYAPDIIKPNLSEFVSTFGIKKEISENEENTEVKERVIEIAKNLYNQYGTKSVITRGKYSTWVYDGASFFTIDNKNVAVVNTIGCGDTFTASLTHSLLNGEKLENAVKFASLCAQKKATHLTLDI